jgi:hypothetical protein
LRLFFREDEQEQTIFAPTENNLSFSILLQLLDHMNFAEVLSQNIIICILSFLKVLRHYVESDQSFPRSILQILESNYPFVSLGQRLTVLKWMCNRFFDTQIFKKMIKEDGARIKVC